jgi:manganese/zinc/iron transport system substrate-binding protein
MIMKYKVYPVNASLLYLQLAMAGIAFLLTSCGNKDSAARHDKLVIVATTGMIKDAIEHVAGDHAEVIALMGPGVDPHLYKATQGDVEKLSNADIVFYNGLHLEGKMGEVLEKLGHAKPVIAVASDIPDSLLRAVPGFQGTHDPHIWFDVQLWENAVRTVCKTLEKQDAANAAYYTLQRDAYIKKLDSLHEAVKIKVAEIPQQQRVLITAHDAFGYFGDAYNIEVKGLQGISTMSEFGVKDVTDLVNFIIARKIKAIFVETSVSQKSIEAVVEGCHEKGWDVKIGGSLYSDAMGNAGTPEGSYIGMVSANVKTITEALK